MWLTTRQIIIKALLYTVVTLLTFSFTIGVILFLFWQISEGNPWPFLIVTSILTVSLIFIGFYNSIDRFDSKLFNNMESKSK